MTVPEMMDEIERKDAALQALPDYIDLFRIIRSAGRSDAAKARAVDDYLARIRAASVKKHRGRS